MHRNAFLAILATSFLLGCCGIIMPERNETNPPDVVDNTTFDDIVGDIEADVLLELVENDTNIVENETIEPNETIIDDSPPTKYGLVIAGVSGDEQHYGWFRDSSHSMYRVFIDNLSYAPEDVHYLFENASEPDVDAVSTEADLRTALADIADRARPQDNVTLFFIGHGNPNGYSASDHTVLLADLADWIDSIRAERINIIMSPCSSGGFIPHLSGPGRIVVTSTQADESNRAAFAERMIWKFAENKTIGEAYDYTIAEVTADYERNQWGNLTEHALLDDDGDGVGHYGPLPNEGDGELALATYI